MKRTTLLISLIIIAVVAIIIIVVFNSKPNKVIHQKEPQQPLKIVVPTIPAMITDGNERNVFLANHFWDNFDFTDTVYINKPVPTEQAIADYISVLFQTNSNIAIQSIKKNLQKAEVNSSMYNYFLEVLKRYLYDPNSPAQNEELYIPVLEFIINDSISNFADKERAKYALGILEKNKIGETATDFAYATESDKVGTLFKIKANYTIVLFYNPDCNACEVVINQSKLSTVINNLLDNKKLALLSFYPDLDIKMWKNHLLNIPNKWINGYDKEGVVSKNQLYDLKAIPTIYLLDKEKRVILKDVTFSKLEGWLVSNVNL